MRKLVLCLIVTALLLPTAAMAVLSNPQSYQKATFGGNTLDYPAILTSNSAGEYGLYEMTNNGTLHAVTAIAGNNEMSPFGRTTAIQSIIDAAFRRGQMAELSSAPDGLDILIQLNGDVGVVTVESSYIVTASELFLEVENYENIQVWDNTRGDLE